MLLAKELNSMAGINQVCMDFHSLIMYGTTKHEAFKELQIEMDLEMHSFQQHMEIYWLSMGPSIKKILVKWEAITHFVAGFAKD